MSSLKKQVQPWWEEEELLYFQVLMSTTPGHSPTSGWQNHADPAIEVDVIRASNAAATHGIGFMSGHNTNQFCYFKSKHFKEQRRDYLEAYLEKSRKAGYRTLIYFNVHAIKPEFGEDHPEWRQIRYDGSPIDDLYGIETSMCVNTGFRDWVKNVCLDLCKYPIDGIFFDGPCLFSKCCYCPSCREEYREKYGTDMPPKEPGHPDLKKLADFQAESLRDFLAHSNQAIKSVRPDVALYCNAGPREEPYYIVGRNNRILIEGQDVLAAEGGFVYGELSGQPVWKVGSNVKYYQTQAGGKPTGVFISAAHGPWRCCMLSDAELVVNFVQAPVHGSGLWNGMFKRSTNQSAFKALAEHYKFFRDNRKFYFKTRSKVRVAIVWPEDSINFYAKPQVLHGDFTQGGQESETVGDIHSEFNGFYDALIKSHIPCDIIDEESIRRKEIDKYDLLLLPNVGCTGEAVDNSLREYVRNGGNVIGSFETSLCDENGHRRDELSLSDLFGVRMLRTPLKPYPHFYFFRQNNHEATFSDIQAELLPAPLISCEVSLDGAEVISPYSVKFEGWDGSEITPSEFPALTMNRFGKGMAIYMAGVFGSHYWKYKQVDIRLLLRNLFEQLSNRDVKVENAPVSVEVVHRESNDGSREMVSLINYTGGQTRPFERIERLENITVRVKTNRRQAFALRFGIDLKPERDGQWLRFNLPHLDIFETIVIE